MDLIRDLPKDEQPAQRLDRHGPETLSDSELLAVVLGCRSLGQARSLSAAIRDARLPRSATPPQRRRFAAAIELARRLRAAEEPAATWNSQAWGGRLLDRFAHTAQEHLGVILLDSRLRVIRGAQDVYIGTINHAAVSTRDVIRLALEHNATTVVLYHNHPSGDPSPSAEDLTYTRKVVEALGLCEIELADHLILGRHRYYSMRERGQI